MKSPSWLKYLQVFNVFLFLFDARLEANNGHPARMVMWLILAGFFAACAFFNFREGWKRDKINF
jgi:hypothetical protein